ncbi:MAG: hypothetical protein ACP5QA_15970, partial [Phycisphaerae bacterium]
MDVFGKWKFGWLAAVAMLLPAGCARQSAKTATYQGESNRAASIIAQRKLTPADVVGALKTFEPPGRRDKYLMFASGGQGGGIFVWGFPSMRQLANIPVFTPDSMAGWGYGGV